MNSFTGSFRLSATAFVAAIALVFALPATALAQAGDPTADPTAAQYEAPAGGDERPAPTPPTDDRVATSGTLPFTGFDAGVVAAVALLLGATGLALRRVTTVR